MKSDSKDSDMNDAASQGRALAGVLGLHGLDATMFTRGFMAAALCDGLAGESDTQRDARRWRAMMAHDVVIVWRFMDGTFDIRLERNATALHKEGVEMLCDLLDKDTD